MPGEDPQARAIDVIDELTALLAARPPDGVARGGLAIRLRELLRQVTAPDEHDDGDFETASTDEVLAYIDNELGRRPGQ